MKIHLSINSSILILFILIGLSAQSLSCNISTSDQISFGAQAYLKNQLPFNKIPRVGITYTKNYANYTECTFEELIKNADINILSLNLLNMTTQEKEEILNNALTKLNDYYKRNTRFMIIDLIMDNTLNEISIESSLITLLNNYSFINILKQIDYQSYNVQSSLLSLSTDDLIKKGKNVMFTTKVININNTLNYDIIFKLQIFQTNLINITDPIDWTTFLNPFNFFITNSNKQICSIQLNSTLYPINDIFPYAFIPKNSINNANIENISTALLCNASIIQDFDPISFNILPSQKALFISIKSELQNNTINCFKAQQGDYNMLFLKLSENCTNIIPLYTLCRNSITNKLSFGLTSKSLFSNIHDNICPNDSIFTTPRNLQETKIVIDLMNKNMVDEIWISLIANTTTNSNVWNEINITNYAIKSKNEGFFDQLFTVKYFYVYISLGGFFISLIIIFIMSKVCKLKKSGKQEQDRKSLINENLSDMIPPSMERNPTGDQKEKKREKNKDEKEKKIKKERRMKSIDNPKKKVQLNSRFISDASLIGQEFKTTNALKLDEVQHFGAIDNDKIITHIANSPDSNESSSHQSSVRPTPKNIDFTVEFSMIDQDSKIKTSRHAFENDDEADQ